MKKILIIAGGLQIGGAERVGRDIGFFADKQKFQVHYLVFGSEIGEHEAELMQQGCQIIHMDPPAKNHLAFYRNLKALIRREQYDVIHSHTMFNSGWAMMAGKACGVPVRIAHSHSIRGPEKRSALKNVYEKTMRHIILRYATHLVACGDGAGCWLYGEKEFRKKGILIYNGIDLARFTYDLGVRQEIRKQLKLENAFVIGHAGHMFPVKNQGFLLGMMPEILKIRPEARLLLLGDGPDRMLLKEQTRQSGLEQKIIMTGNVSHVEQYLSAMDVFAFPSLYEGMPLALIEAQANGLPCVISDRIPGDVHLTDLVTAHSLEGNQKNWVEAICSAQRNTPESYCVLLHKAGLDTMGMLERIYALYEGC